VIELTWWSAGETSGKICGVRVVQLGGEALRFLRLEPNVEHSEAKLLMKIADKNIWDNTDSPIERRLLADGSLMDH
jgi:hypothetical protein